MYRCIRLTLRNSNHNINHNNNEESKQLESKNQCQNPYHNNPNITHSHALYLLIQAIKYNPYLVNKMLNCLPTKKGEGKESHYRQSTTQRSKKTHSS